MTSTNEKVRNAVSSANEYPTPQAASRGMERVLSLIEGRWTLVILFSLFGGEVLRFSELERAIPGVSQKMLIQQLRQLEKDGIVQRTSFPEVPPRVDYRLTSWGEELCPSLDSLLCWGLAGPHSATD